MNSLILLISFIAPQFNISPALAIAVAQTESSLNPSAIGPRKEVGLFQVRPEYSKFTAKQLLDPQINIHEGLRILSEAKRKCKHQLERTFLVCYNLGVYGGSKIKHPKRFKYYVKVMNKIADAY
jgi:soluble lytic murein transglycosylase-like protein